jgi:hypothetical protein
MACSLVNYSRQYSLSFKDCGLSLVTGLSALPYCLRHIELAAQCSGQTKRWGHRAIAFVYCLPGSILFGLVERIIIWIYNKLFSKEIQPVKKPVLIAKNIEDLISKINRLSDENGNPVAAVPGKILASGGSKHAVSLNNGCVLMLPHPNKGKSYENWEAIMANEMAMSEALNRIGLIGQKWQRVTVHLISGVLLPAYMAPSFASLQKEGFFVLEKLSVGCTWTKSKKKLFNKQENRSQPEKWDPVIKELLKDVAKLSCYQISTGFDSLSVAILERRGGVEEGESLYEARYFGFDFPFFGEYTASNALTARVLEEGEEGDFPCDLLKRLLDQLLYDEFAESVSDPRGTQFLKLLIERYKPSLMQEVERLRRALLTPSISRQSLLRYSSTSE